MRRAIAALLIGLALGYRWGYGDAADGKPSVTTRTLDRFGVSKVRNAQSAYERGIQDASKP